MNCLEQFSSKGELLMAVVNLQVAYNPLSLEAHVQIQGTALPNGTVNVGTFQFTPSVQYLRGDLTSVYFHNVRDLLYKRKPDGSPGFFPNNITDMHRITIKADAAVPRAMMAEEPEEPINEPIPVGEDHPPVVIKVGDEPQSPADTVDGASGQDTTAAA